MIQPVLSGQALLDDINNAHPQPGEVGIWWLGQSGYAIKTASMLFYVDLYLSEHLTAKYADTDKPHIRMTTAPIRGHEITQARWVFASHKHSDHLDPGTLPALFAASPDAKLILPAALVDHAVTMGLEAERLIATRGSETFMIDSMRVHSVPSAHPELDYSETYGYPFLGFVFEVDGVTLYHSGDTLAYPQLAEHLAPFLPDIVFLPINGTDEWRNQLKVPPNMNAAEAVALARSVDAKLLIPHHYDMFTFNTAEVSEFTPLAEIAEQPYAVLRCGERFTYRSDGR
jgi:L-ascorbate 6-phosphate lactonase